MPKWERFNSLQKEIRIVLDLPPEVLESLMINTSSLKRLLSLGGFDFVRLSSERREILDFQEIRDTTALFRYEISPSDAESHNSLANWRSLHIILDLNGLERFLKNHPANTTELTAQINRSLRQAITQAGWENNISGIHSFDVVIDLFGINFLYFMQYYYLLSQTEPSLAQQMGAVVSSVILYGVMSHLVDSQLFNRLKGNKALTQDVRFSLFRSAHIDRAMALSFLGKTSQLVKQDGS